MKLAKDFQFNDAFYPAGEDVPWYYVYPFFLVHMLMFGTFCFMSVYAAKQPNLWFIYGWNGLALFVYTVFYNALFGLDEVKWMFINATLGIVGVYTQVGWLLSVFGKHISDYPLRFQIAPFLFFIFYTFLIRHAVLDLFNAHESKHKRKRVEFGYVAMSLAVSASSYFLTDLSLFSRL